MRRLTVVIPSRNPVNLKACTDAIIQHEPDCRILVVWDRSRGNDYMPPTAHYDVREVDSDFIYSRNCNIGISEASSDDIVLANDDALLRTPGGFTAIQRAAYENPEYGVISSTCNNVGNIRQHPYPGGGLREEIRMLCFVCVFIPRSTIEAVGLLDERFGGNDASGQVIYGHDDDDYCLRVRNAGLKLGIFDGCYCDHASLRSTFRGNGPVSIEPSRRLFQEKWGVQE